MLISNFFVMLIFFKFANKIANICYCIIWLSFFIIWPIVNLIRSSATACSRPSERVSSTVCSYIFPTSLSSTSISTTTGLVRAARLFQPTATLSATSTCIYLADAVPWSLPSTKCCGCQLSAPQPDFFNVYEPFSCTQCARSDADLPSSCSSTPSSSGLLLLVIYLFCLNLLINIICKHLL